MSDKKVQILDFEKPIYKIQDKIDELKKTSIDTNIDYNDEIKKIGRTNKSVQKRII